MSPRAAAPLLVLALIGLGLILAFWSFKPFGVLHDDAHYVRNALGWLGVVPPAPYRAHSVGPSVAVLPYLALAGTDLQWIRLVPTAFSVAWVVLFSICAARVVDRRVAWLLALCVFASPGFLLNAPNVMGEPILSFWIWSAVALAGLPASRGRDIAWWVCGVSACFTRSEGVALPFALAVWHILEGRRKQAMLYLGAVGLGLALINAVFIERGPKYHQLELTAYFKALPALETYPTLWLSKTVSVLGSTYLAGNSPDAPRKIVSTAAAVLLLVLSLPGWWRLRENTSARLVQVLAPCLLAGVFAWPWVQPRHLLALWPVLLLCAALAMPARGRIPCLAVLAVTLLVVAIPNLDQGRRSRQELNAGFLQTIDFLRNSTPRDATLLSNLDATYSLLTGRRVEIFNAEASYPELLLALHQKGQVYLVFEQVNATLKDVRGINNSTGGQQLREWLSHSPYLSAVCTNAAQTVYLFEPQPGYEQAYQKWVESHAAGLSLKERRALLESSLKLCPDLPFVNTALAQIDAEEGRLEPARSRLEIVVKRYPFDLSSLYTLVQVTHQLGENERAAQFATYGQELSVAQGDRAMSQFFQRYMP